MYKRYSHGIMAVALMIGLASCTREKKLSLVIANVLSKALFDDCRIKGSINVPFMDLVSYAEQHWDKENTQIVVHCSNYACAASGEGCKMLKSAGFKHVWAFEGGTAEAKAAGIPVEGECKQAYLTNYEKPEMYHHDEKVAVISVEELKKKMEEFAINR
jgi:rhodanese-related sulfurtransferase